MDQRSYNTMSAGRSMDLLTKTENNGGFWSRRTNTEICLIVFCAILTIVVIGLIIGIVVLSKKETKGDSETTTTTEAPITITASPSEEVCKSDTCKKAAFLLNATINTSVDPCEDFYSYVCSGWQKDHPIPETMSSYSSFTILGEDITKKLKEVLTNTTFEDEDVRTKTKTFYNSCINNDTREAKGVDGLKEILQQLGGWPLLGNELSSDYDWLEALAYEIKEFSSSPIITVAVDADAKNTTRNVIQLDQTSLGIGRNVLISTNDSDPRTLEIMTAYRKLINSSAWLLGAENENLSAAIDYMIEFEKRLANITRSAEDRRDPNSLYNKMDLSVLQQIIKSRGIDIASLLRMVFANITQISDETEIIVLEFNYLYQLATLVTTVEKETIANYIGWSIVRDYGPATNQEFRDAFLEFDKVMSGVEKAKPLEDMCIEETNDFFPFSLGNIYINSEFDPATKTEIENMIFKMKDAFNELLETNNWMNEESKKQAKYKLDAMIPMIAFPPWSNDTIELNKYYEKLGDINEDTYFDNVVTLAKFYSQSNLNKINEPHNRTTEWVTGPAIVNAFYNPNANTITFPAGILNSPFYKYGLPASLNFGGIGNVIGHEITHGFDDEGSQYDAEGNLKDWWPAEVRQKFKNETECFVKQYESYTDPVTGMQLNGKNTLGENIGDNGGIREAFKAYKAFEAATGHSFTLPGLKFTTDQLFFISFSYIWCANERKEELEHLIQYNAHSPPRYRVLLPCSNSEDFAKAFQCPKNSTMNPEQRCVVW